MERRRKEEEEKNMAAGNIPMPFKMEGERERDATKPVQSQGLPPCPTYPPPTSVAQQQGGGSPDFKILATGSLGHGSDQIKAQLMIQRIPDITGKMCTVLWYTGAQISLHCIPAEANSDLETVW
jgi:hypothetical protein